MRYGIRIRGRLWFGEKFSLRLPLVRINHIIILIDGGHGFKILKPTEIIEIKQGPYSQKKDKKVFTPIDDLRVKLK